MGLAHEQRLLPGTLPENRCFDQPCPFWKIIASTALYAGVEA
jgi:hypothetical protein